MKTKLIAGVAALVVAMLGSPVWAQDLSQARVRGTQHGSDEAGQWVLEFECIGTPTCVGTHTLTDRWTNCSNILSISGEFRLTNLHLAAPGPLSGTVEARPADYDIDRHANGTCSIRPGSIRDHSGPYTGHWDGNNGTIVAGDDAPLIFKVDLPPVFPMVVHSNIDANTATASADIQFRPQDVGQQGSIFVFAMAPASRVQGGTSSNVLKLGFAKDAKKADTPIGCVLAQLNAAGQMVAVNSANLGAYLTGVLSAQGASVSILNGVPTGNVSGATFFVGYGSSGTTMINTGVNRAAVTVPGSLECRPSAPQTGWWWNPLEDGRGFSIEKRGNNLFFAAFLYDVSGRSTWHVSSGPVSLEGSLYNGDLLSARGGQTLGGAYPGFPSLSAAGSMTLTFNNEATGTLVWSGGTVPIQRFNIVPNGLVAPAVAGTPESGWWWNESEAGRGFFMEWQNGTLDIAGYMYDDNGNPVWYLAVGGIGGTAAARSFTGNWLSFGNGMTLAGPWRQHGMVNSNVAPLTITFSAADTALMTLPNGRTTALRRHRF